MANILLVALVSDDGQDIYVLVRTRSPVWSTGVRTPRPISCRFFISDDVWCSVQIAYTIQQRAVKQRRLMDRGIQSDLVTDYATELLVAFEVSAGKTEQARRIVRLAA